MTPAQIAARSHGGLIQLHPPLLQTLEPLPEETVEEAAYRAAVDAAVAVLEAYDDGTAEHSDDVVTLSEAIAERLNVPGEDRKHLRAVAQLHDIGKVTVPPEILNKPGPLNDLEWHVMRRHTIEGERILASVPEITPVARMVRACHERYDGDGYPDGLAGEDIPLVSRIVFCADAFHAMRCDRPYRAGRPVGDALDELRAHAGTQFDPVVVAALCEVHKKLAGQRRRRGGLVGATARSRRLAALLAVLTVSGSAMAATGAYKSLPVVGGGSDAAPGLEAQGSASERGSKSAAADAGSELRAAAAAGNSASSAATGSSSGGQSTGKASPDPRGVAHGVRGTSPAPGGSKNNGNPNSNAGGNAIDKVKKPKKDKAPKEPGPPASLPPHAKAPKVETPAARPPKPPRPARPPQAQGPPASPGNGNKPAKPDTLARD